MKKFVTKVDVVTAARQRIKNVFSNGVPVLLSVSGGKDSICLNDLTYQLAQRGEIDKSLLRVIFIDEEAIYPCIEETVMRIRKQWLLLGVPFDWYAMEYKHFNCLNALSQDETFVCFDETKKDVWVRQPPPFAIRNHPLLVRGKDSYQDFSAKAFKGYLLMIGTRASESIQRAKNLAVATVQSTSKAFPIYDWTDADVWKYIYDNNLPFPKAYMYMYQCGVPMNKMRISQFFSIDTIGSLVRMCEFYPNLFDRICKREPNAYMTMLYYDTELFRRKKSKGKEDDETDYKAKVLEYMNTAAFWDSPGKQKLYKEMKALLIKHGSLFGTKQWKMAYNICLGGDPKRRTIRALTYATYAENAKKAYADEERRRQK